MKQIEFYSNPPNRLSLPQMGLDFLEMIRYRRLRTVV